MCKKVISMEKKPAETRKVNKQQQPSQKCCLL